MKPFFVRTRKSWRTVMVVPAHLSGLAPHLKRKRFYPIVLPPKPLDEEMNELLLSGRTLVTDRPEDLGDDDIPVIEFSLMDITQVKADEAALAGMISRAWARHRLKTEGCFILRLRPDGKHQIEFPE